MNFLHPRVVNALTAARLAHCSLLYSLILANARLQASGTCGLEQRELAARLRRSRRQIIRQELALIRAGFLQTIRHGRCNRRQLRPVPLEALPVVARERGHRCHNSRDTDVTSLGGDTVSSLDSKKNIQRRAESDRAARGGIQASPAKEKTALPGLPPADRRRLFEATADFVEVCRVFKHAWPEVHELVAERVRLDGLARTLDHLRWVAEKTRGAAREDRGARTLGLLRSTHGKLADRRSARSGRVPG